MNRRRLTILSLLLMVLSGTLPLSADVQPESGRRLWVGVRGGAALARVQFNPSVPQSMLAGVTAGVAVRYTEERHFGLLGELLLTQRGWKETFDADYDLRYRRRLTYLELPLLTHITFGSRRVKGFVNAGPQLGYLLAWSTSANFDVDAANNADFPIANRSTAQFSLKPKNRFDYGITAGLGMELVVSSRSSIALEGRFYYGMRDLFANHRGDDFSGSSAMTVAVSLAYYYRLR